MFGENQDCQDLLTLCSVLYRYFNGLQQNADDVSSTKQEAGKDDS